LGVIFDGSQTSVAGAHLSSAEPWLWSPGKQAELSGNDPEAASDSQL